MRSSSKNRITIIDQTKWYEVLTCRADMLRAYFTHFRTPLNAGFRASSTLRPLRSIQYFVTGTQPTVVGRESAFLTAQAYQSKD